MYDNLFSELPISKALDWASDSSQHFRLSENVVNKADSAIETFVYKLRKEIGRTTAPFSTNAGTHPEFQELREGQNRKAPTISMFIDIKGSTQLYEKYSYERASFMEDAIVTSAVYVVNALDGHVIRTQGDGLFATFNREEASIENSTLDALSAASTLILLLESYLSKKFQALGLKPLKVKVGIDYDTGACWKHNGSEISPRGLHVSLASKLQDRAASNTIMIGDNIKNLLQLPDEFLSIKKEQEGGELKDKPFIRGSYRMWVFNWLSHARNFSWVKKQRGKLLPAISGQPSFSLQAAIVSPDGVLQRTFPSSMEVLDKGLSLKFVLGPLPKGCSIRWYIENRGIEAEAANDLKFEIEHERNKTSAEASTKYQGHHYLICRVTYPSRKTVEKRIGVFIGPNWAEPPLLIYSEKSPAPQHRLNETLIPQTV